MFLCRCVAGLRPLDLYAVNGGLLVHPGLGRRYRGSRKSLSPENRGLRTLIKWLPYWETRRSAHKMPREPTRVMVEKG